MKWNYYPLLLALIIFFACNKSQKIIDQLDYSDVKTITIDTKQGTMLPLDSLIKKIEFVKLETTNECLIGSISQLFFIDSLIVVVDAKISKSIYFFDKHGKYMYRISQTGNGPNEYVSISNVSIVPSKKLLTILDRMQNKVIYYDLNGKYKSSEHTPFQLSYFEYLESDSKAYEISQMNDTKIGEYRNYSLVVTNSKNDICYGVFHDIKNPNFTFTMHLPLRKFKETVYYSPNFSNEIYTINDTTVKAKYYIDLRQNKMPVLSENITDEQFREYCKEYFFFNGDFVELKDFTYINIATPWGYPSAVYSHRQQKTFLNSGKGDHPFFTFLSTAPKARFEDNVIVIDVHAYIIHAIKKGLYINDKYNEVVDSLFENLTEDSNPVLFFYYLNPNL